MQSWVALAIWTRLMVSCLGQIQQFSWVIGLIKHSFTQTLFFLTVFILGVTAFADSFNTFEQRFLIDDSVINSMGLTGDAFIIEKLKKLDNTMESNFESWLLCWQRAFRASLGDFDGTTFLVYFSYIDWIIFFLACAFLIILMLNLLISVITEAQAEYTAKKVQTSYREKA